MVRGFMSTSTSLRFRTVPTRSSTRSTRFSTTSRTQASGNCGSDVGTPISTRLFQTAKDGILILDANTLKIIDANPFMTELLGYTYDEFVGKELWEIGSVGIKPRS